MDKIQKIKILLAEIYVEEKGQTAFERLQPIIEKFAGQKRKQEEFFSQADVVLITYGDTLQKQGQAPIATLHEFADKYLKGAVSTIHFLPFFPSHRMTDSRSWISSKLIRSWAPGKT